LSESAAPARDMRGSRALLSIQILRAVAALGVLFHHTAHEVAAKTGVTVPFAELVVGAGGVDLFFVISGFVMVYASERLFAQPGATRIFFLRRLARIVPLYWAATAILVGYIYVAHRIFPPPFITTEGVIASFLFIPYPLPNGLMAPVHALGWTLNYEMFFYTALLLLFWCRRRIQRSLILTVAFGALVLLSFAIPPKASMLAFYANIALIPFLVGVWLAEASAFFERVPRWGILALIIAAALATAWLYQLPFDTMRDLMPHLVMTLAATLIVAAGLSCERRFARRGLLQMVGNSSYSLYLTHMFVVGAAWAAIERVDLPVLVHWGLTPLIYAAALVTAYASYRAIELPFNRLAHRLTQRPMRTAIAE